MSLKPQAFFAAPNGIWRGVVTSLFLVGATLAVFSPVLAAGFLEWDDDLNITDNLHIRALDSPHLQWMFSDCAYMRRYVPLAWLAWAVLFRLFGLNPLAYHAWNLLLHAANVLLVFWLLRTLLDLSARGPATRNSWRPTVCAGAAALIWAVHPLRVEVVAWANCAMYTEALFLLLLSLFFYLRYATSGAGNPGPLQPSPARRLTWYSLSFFLFACSLLIYPVGVGFVVVLAILDFYPLGRFPSFPERWLGVKAFQVWADKLPFLAITLGNSFINLWARAHAGGIWAQPIPASWGFTIWHRLAQAFYIWAHYLWKPLLPVNLCPVYTTLVSFQPAQPAFVISLCLVASTTVVVLLLRRRWPLGLACWVAYLALLVPMLGLTEHPHFPADRYSYLVGILASILIAAGLSALWRYPRARASSLASTLALAGVLGCLTLRQTRIWHDSETLFRYVLANLKSDPCASDIHWRLGMILARQQRFTDAQAQFETALSLKPNFGEAHHSLGRLLMIQGRTNEAIAQFQEAVRLKPGDAPAQRDLGVALGRQGHLDDGVGHLKKALTFAPGDAEAHYGLGVTLGKQGRLDEAIGQFQEAQKLNPNWAEAHCGLGGALSRKMRLEEAIGELKEALRLNPDYAEAHCNLGVALGKQGRLEDAITHFEKALRLNPDYANAQNNLRAARNLKAAVSATPTALPQP